MKTLFIQESKAAILAFFLSICCFTANAQDIATILFGENEKTDYIGQLNYNGKRKNGFGMERQRNGTIYVGDFSEDKMSGRGMLIASSKGISNVEGAIVYVGSWRNGKKEGKGSCYDANGNLIYEGRFANDKPTEKMTPSGTTKSFRITDVGTDLYLGEMTGNTPDGFGLTVEEDGSIVYGVMTNGIRQGIGMKVYTAEIWEVGKWTDGTFRSFNSSQQANSKLESYKTANKAWKKELRSMLSEAAFNFAQAGVSTATIVNDVKENKASASGAVSNIDDDGENIASGQSQDYYQTLYNKWELKAKNAYEDRVHHKVTASSGSDGRVASSDAKTLRQYQKAMRNVRSMAKKNGYNIKQSKYETISF